MQKESLLFFSFSSESTFGGAKVRISENNKNKFVFLLQSRTKVLSAEPKVRISERKTKNIWIFPNESTFGGAKVRKI